ncbi:MAG: 4-oxalocrotonate tautomerase family protein [Alistipes sp.]|nr:4-oxalocrotonate tautomerase family protein [Alistipes sp.]MDE5694710.1 4-oxalocrotonate tautomerase family protein [Alistipes sp.]MDE6508570.1 4-oxalocrotonate tautomerase family protein [Alistipes sp.]
MPYISIECGTLTASQKQALIERVTLAAAEATSIPQQFFMVAVKELPDTSFGIGGRTIDRIKAEYPKGE